MGRMDAALRMPITTKRRMTGHGIMDTAKTVGSHVGKYLLSSFMMDPVGTYVSVNDTFGSRITNDKFVSSLDDERPYHALGFNYLGPNTDAEHRTALGVLPVNATDACAQQHDLDYGMIKKQVEDMKITRTQADKKVRAVDNKFRKCLDEADVDGWYEKAINRGSNSIFGLKAMAEDVGVIPASQFAGYGEKKNAITDQIKKKQKKEEREKEKKDPLKNLRIEAMKLTGGKSRYTKRCKPAPTNLHKTLSKLAIDSI
jgi:hypothetical protein